MVSAAALAAAIMLPQLRVVFETVSLTSEQLLAALALSTAVPILNGLFSWKK